MKKYLFLCLLVGLAFSNSVFAEAEDTSNPNAPKVSSEDVLSKEASDTKNSLVPDSVPMSLDFTKSDAIMPANFRGGDPDKGLVNVLEDVYYEKHEHCLIYEEDAKKLTPDQKQAKFDSDPNITWDTKRKGSDGNYHPVKEPENTNVARNGGYFYDTGDYHIGNDGAREVGGGKVTDTPETTECGTPEGASGSKDKGTDGTTPTCSVEGAEGGKVFNDDSLVNDDTKTVTSRQTMGVFVHDCTCPDVWVAFQEGVGNINMASCKSELVERIQKDCLSLKGRPDVTEDNKNKFEDYSLLCVDEGRTADRDKEPWNKTATLSAIGAMFNEDGVVKANQEVNIKTGCISKEDQTRLAPVSIDENKNKENATDVKKVLNGVYVRRNVPFIFAATSIDNGTDREKQTPVVARLENADGSEITASPDNSYIFRVANYPRENYKDQPDYYFVAKARDDSGNITSIRLPLYVLDSNASFETSAK
jgi:hypothetical protein